MKSIVTIHKVAEKTASGKTGAFKYWRAYTDNGITFTMSEQKTKGLSAADIALGQQYLVDIYPVVKEGVTWWNACSIAPLDEMGHDEQLMLRLNLLELKLDLLLRGLGLNGEKPARQPEAARQADDQPEPGGELPF